MRPQILTFIIIMLIMPLIAYSQIYAANSDVVINEILPNPEDSEDGEFIELYNKGTDAVNISGWKLLDIGGSTSSYVIPEDTIPAGGYRSYRKSVTGIALNNDGNEGVILKDSSDQQIDSMNFNTNKKGRTWSRIPNGTGGFVNDTTPTENAVNISPPTPTIQPPTPTNIPPTPTPTKPANTPTPTPVVTVNTPTPTKKPTPTPTTDPVKAAQAATMAAAMMGAQDQAPQHEVKSAQDSVDLGGSLSDLDKKETAYNWGKLLILMGAVLVTCACGILVYNNYLKDKLEEMRSQP